MPQVSLEDYESKRHENGPNEPVVYDINVFYKIPNLSNSIKKVSIEIKMTN